MTEFQGTGGNYIDVRGGIGMIHIDFISALFDTTQGESI